MNKFFQWIIGISVIVLVLTFAISTLVPVFVPSLRPTLVMPHQGMMGDGGAHMFGERGPGMMGEGGARMFGGRGMGGGFGRPFFGFGMLLIPALFIGAAIWGASWLMRALRQPSAALTATPAPTVTTAPCAHCAQPLQAGWKACPYCGEKIQ